MKQLLVLWIWLVLFQLHFLVIKLLVKVQEFTFDDTRLQSIDFDLLTRLLDGQWVLVHFARCLFLPLTDTLLDNIETRVFVTICLNFGSFRVQIKRSCKNWRNFRLLHLVIASIITHQVLGLHNLQSSFCYTHLVFTLVVWLFSVAEFLWFYRLYFVLCILHFNDDLVLILLLIHNWGKLFRDHILLYDTLPFFWALSTLSWQFNHSAWLFYDWFGRFLLHRFFGSFWIIKIFTLRTKSYSVGMHFFDRQSLSWQSYGFWCI